MSIDSQRERDSRDPTGRDRMAWNVITSWGSYMVFVVAGFILPRMIDRYVGQVSLGIWDFCWSIVHYLTLTGFGVGSSVNRYVAMHRIRNDVEGLCCTVSTVMAIQIMIGVVMLLGTLVLAHQLPFILSDKLGENIRTIQLVVILLGASLAFDMSLQSARGVLTGCHRWDINNGINTVSQALATVAMIVALHVRGDLVSLAFAYLVVTIATELWRTYTAFRLCPEVRVRIGYMKWSQAKKLIQFGGKSIINELSNFLPVQTASILVAAALGPAALAIMARPLALVRHMQMFMRRFSMVLTPMVGSLHGAGREEALRQLVVTTARYGVAFTLPMVLVLVVDGDLILKLWMGAGYAHGNVITILALGYLLPVASGSLTHVLMGINAHGRIALIKLVVVMAAFLIGIAVVYTVGWSLEAAAWLIAVSMTLGGGVVVTVLACRRLNIRIWNYARRAYLTPVFCNVAFAVVLYAARWIFVGEPLWALGVGCVCGGALLGVLYWRYVATQGARQWVEDAMHRAWMKIRGAIITGQQSP